jgi:hypothetical protein
MHWHSHENNMLVSKLQISSTKEEIYLEKLLVVLPLSFSCLSGIKITSVIIANKIDSSISVVLYSSNAPFFLFIYFISKVLRISLLGNKSGVKPMIIIKFITFALSNCL